MAKRIAKFEKVSYEQFLEDYQKQGFLKEDTKTEINRVKSIWSQIEKPKRSTACSAGYDFKAPFNINLKAGDTIVIPTGIRCEMFDNWVLKCYPRSGHGFKYKCRLANTVAILDSDYYYSDNEGHIMIKLSNENTENKILKIEQGQGFCQGIFVEYGITVDDDVEEIRNGGFGSTDKK